VLVDVSVPTGLSLDQMPSSDFFQPGEGGRVLLTTDYRFLPHQFGAKIRAQEGEAFGVCSPADPLSRCNADCNTQFNSPNRNDDDWVGYRSGSSYCQCLMGGATPFIPARELNPETLDYATTADYERLNHCARAFGCSYNRVQDHPGLRLACTGSCLFRGSNDESLIIPDGQGHVRLRPNIIPLPGGHYDQSNDLTNFPVLVDGVDAHAIDCNSGNRFPGAGAPSCLDVASAYARGGNPWGGVDIFTQTCECRTHQRNSSGEDLGTVIGMNANAQLDWGTICNLGGDPANPVCPNTREPGTTGTPGPYILRSGSTNPQGLSQYQAQLCSCLEVAGAPSTFSYNPQYAGFLDTTADPLNVTFAGVSRDLPWRSIGALERTSAAGTIIPAVANCAAHFHSNAGGATRSSCIALNPETAVYSAHVSAQVFEDFVTARGMVAPSTQNAYQAIGLCRSSCNWLGDMQVFRNLVSATVSPEVRPAWCGPPGSPNGGGPGPGDDLF